MSGKYKISIIIPVYNVEDYIIECLNSIDFTKKNWQVVLVNDGSTDNSYELIKPYAKYENVKIISQKNLGLSEARNSGVKVADGEYVMFLDSDDMLYEGFQDKIDESANLDGTIYFFSIILKLGKKLIYDELVFDKYKIDRLNSKEMQNFFRKKKIAFVVNRYVIPIEIARSLEFEKGVYHEDELVTTKLLLIENNFKYIDTHYIYRKQRPNSITSTVSIKHFESIIKILNILNGMKENKFTNYEKSKLTLSLLSKYGKVWREVTDASEFEKLIKANRKYIIVNNLKKFILKTSLYILGVNKTLKLILKHETH